ncbi:hypothetical protein [Brevundimonas subvibrioides]|uniref:Uncharacterized protein n=1 Tax=Brevundimonas subvibrioides (strain ATCC 15264 / DSM 4735 / LMG 14903 / NBRC 16000 / CB 81) TaxID=633149 RepID=D9QJL1_BRESC|nr:hypothetical protein [Brevundimonas subvibrioides]ADL01572.1 hypothetical protein Bresu_2262 [Brevundimonas subvibrioides ATCC 15264]
MDRSQTTNTRIPTALSNTSELQDTFDLQTLSARGLMRDLSDLLQALRTLWLRSTNSVPI